MCDEITNSLPNFSGATVPHFTRRVITYPCTRLKYVVEAGMGDVGVGVRIRGGEGWGSSVNLKRLGCGAVVSYWPGVRGRTRVAAGSRDLWSGVPRKLILILHTIPMIIYGNIIKWNKTKQGAASYVYGLSNLAFFVSSFASSKTLIARFIGPTWGPSGADRTQVGPMLAPWTFYLRMDDWRIMAAIETIATFVMDIYWSYNVHS